METKPLLYGLIGFFIGGALVSIAAPTFDKPELKNDSSMSMTMDSMTDSLKDKTGDDFDKAFLKEMIVHHKGAVAMAELAEKNAQHQDIKNLSDDIITAQNKEIANMIQWQTKWGYVDSSMESMSHQL